MKKFWIHFKVCLVFLCLGGYISAIVIWPEKTGIVTLWILVGALGLTMLVGIYLLLYKAFGGKL